MITYAFRRFIHQEHDRGETLGWRFEVGWFHDASGLTWAWVSRETVDGETQDDS